MKLSMKAALYSGLLFPGAGYFVVQKKLRGSVALLVTIAGLSIIIIESIHKAQIIAEKIVSGAIQLDVKVLRQQILETPGIFNPDLLSGVYFIIGLVWFVGIVDCYRIGGIIQAKDLA